MNVYAKCKNPFIDSKGIAHGCGQCLNCRKSKTLEWVIRCKHEAIMNPKSIYITLTYKPSELKRTAKIKMNGADMRGSLDPEDITKFLKKLRQKYKDKKLRYIYCGEYGEDRWRPHYHMIIWGIKKEEISQEELMEIWGKGYVDKSEETVTENAITYIVSYLNKKKPSKSLEKKIYKDNNRIAPYVRKSQGLGGEWNEKYMENWSKTGTISHNKGQYPIPRYYIKKMYEKEGRKIKYTTANINQITKIPDKKTNYKIIKNPEGEMTKSIQELQENKIYNQIEEWRDTYKLKEPEFQKIKQTYVKEYNRRKKNTINDFEYYKNMEDDEISKLFQWEKIRNKEERGGVESDAPLEIETRKKLKKVIERKEKEILRGLFGKRNKYEKLEELMQTNKE